MNITNIYKHTNNVCNLIDQDFEYASLNVTYHQVIRSHRGRLIAQPGLHDLHHRENPFTVIVPTVKSMPSQWGDKSHKT